MPERLTLMTVHAHPDDESISTGGVMARYAAEGVRVVCVTCTGGENGEIVVPELDTAENHERLADIRRDELRRALEHLGPIDQRWLGYRDSGMMGTPENAHPACLWQADIDEATERLLAIVREVRPDVMVSYNDYGGYGHPDHVRAALVTKRAFEETANGAVRPTKLYEVVTGLSRRAEIRELATARGIRGWWNPPANEPPEEREARERQLRQMNDAQGPITTRVDVTAYVAAKYAAMREHVTQLSSDMIFFALTVEEWRDLVPTEDFTLRVSRVGVRLPEDDLFAGLRESP